MKQDNYNAKRINRSKLQLTAAIIVLIIISGFFIFSSFSLRQVALALTGNYSKTSGNSLDYTDWNNLSNDFLDKSGDTMTGQLNMNSNKIVNLADPTSNTEAANKQYVDSAASTAGGGGAIFVNWGNTDCPGATKLYDGYGFSARYDNTSGGSNPVCIQAGDAGGSHTNMYADMLYPLVTGSNASLPTNAVDSISSIEGDRIIKCAVCYKDGSTCFEGYGRHDCNMGVGDFFSVYEGYVLGSFADNGSNGHYNSTERACVNRNFDSGAAAGGNMGAMWYGAKIENNLGLGYTIDAFIKCAVCCN